MIGAIVHQLTRNLNDEQVREGGFAPYFVDHTTGVYPTAASGFPFSAAALAVKGDVIADLTEDLAAEQKARVTYDNILRLSDGAGSALGTGGMATKLRAAQMVTADGVEMVIANGAHPELLYQIAEGQPAGTRFAAKPRRHG